MKNYRAITILLLTLMIGFGLVQPPQGHLNQMQSVADMIQPSWQFSYERYTNNTNNIRTYFSVTNQSNSQFLWLEDIWSKTTDIYSVTEMNNVINVSSSGVMVSTNTTGSYGNGYNGTGLYISFDSYANQNHTTINNDTYPVVYEPYSNYDTSLFLINDTYFPLPHLFFPQPLFDENTIGLPHPVTWGIGNTTTQPLQISITSSTTNVNINNHDFSVNALFLTISEGQSHFIENGTYTHPVLPFVIDYSLEINYNVEIILTYDQSNGMLLDFYYDVSLDINYESSFVTTYSLVTGQAFTSENPKLYQNDEWMVEAIDNYYYFFEVLDYGYLTSISGLYQTQTTPSSTSASTTSTTETITSTTGVSSSTSSTSSVTNTPTSSTALDNETTNSSDTLGSNSTPPDLNLPAYTIVQFVSTMFLVIAVTKLITRKQK